MPSTLPIEKYPDLHKSFPKDFPFFFNAGSDELNFVGKLAQEVLSLRKLKGVIVEGCLVIDNGNDHAFLGILPIDISSEASNRVAKEVMREELNKFGIILPDLHICHTEKICTA